MIYNNMHKFTKGHICTTKFEYIFKVNLRTDN